jgi:hypothetical protein
VHALIGGDQSIVEAVEDCRRDVEIGEAAGSIGRRCDGSVLTPASRRAVAAVRVECREVAEVESPGARELLALDEQLEGLVATRGCRLTEKRSDGLTCLGRVVTRGGVHESDTGDEFWVIEGDELGDHAAHRGAEQMNFLMTKMSGQIGGIEGHVTQRVPLVVV